MGRETVSRLEAGRRPPNADTVFRLEAALDLMPRSLVPAWPEWAPIGTSAFGAASRRRRRELGLSLGQVARLAGLSAATLSRFEREETPTPSLISYGEWDTEREYPSLTSDALAAALGFSNVGEHERWCRPRRDDDDDGWPGTNA